MLTPKNETDLAEAVKWATGPLRVLGGGTRLAGFDPGGEALSVAGLSGITLYEPGALTLVAAAGTPLAEIEAALAAEGQRLAFEPGDMRAVLGTEGVPTIGGAVAANASGPRRIQAGACRDSLIGVRFVDGRGEIVKNGGRVMKNVTGYDLVKLMAGSHGTLAVLTEVSLKVLPKADRVASLQVAVDGPAAAVAVMSAALGSPYDVTGAVFSPDTGAVSIRLEGFEASVGYRMDKLAADLADHGAVQQAGPEVWDAARDVTDLAGRAALWQVSVKPGDAPALIDSVRQGHRVDYRLDWGGGRVWIAPAPDQPGDPETAIRSLHDSVQTAVARLGGHATLLKTPAKMQIARFQPQPAPVAAISAGLRAQFDPRGILNPGLMG